MALPACRARAEMLLGWRPRESPIAVAEACRPAVMAVLGTRRQWCGSWTEGSVWEGAAGSKVKDTATDDIKRTRDGMAGGALPNGFTTNAVLLGGEV
jgi:hypothetical protein